MIIIGNISDVVAKKSWILLQRRKARRDGSKAGSTFLAEERFFKYHGTGRPPKINQVLSVDLVPAF